MDLKAVTFPALIAADDGWVKYSSSAEGLSLWTTTAIRKYNSRRVFIYDSNDRAWQVESIRPAKPVGLLAKLVGKKVAVHLSVRPVTEAPFQCICDVIKEAIDRDDDIPHSGGFLGRTQSVRPESLFIPYARSCSESEACDLAGYHTSDNGQMCPTQGILSVMRIFRESTILTSVDYREWIRML